MDQLYCHQQRQLPEQLAGIILCTRTLNIFKSGRWGWGDANEEEMKFGYMIFIAGVSNSFFS